MQTDARVGVAVAVDGGGQIALGPEQEDGGSRRKNFLQKKGEIGAVAELLSGGIAGALSKSCTAPMARLTILFQVEGMHSTAATLRRASILQEASRIYKEEGFRAFWKGNLVMIAHRLPYSALNFYAFERYKELLHNLYGLDCKEDNMSKEISIRFISGGMAGMTAASLTYPLDLVRTRLSTQTNATYYNGIGHALRTITREEGLRGLYKGLGATLLGVGPNLAISFSFYETVRSSWQSHRPHDSPAMVSLACGSASALVSSTVIFPLDLVRRRMQMAGAAGGSHLSKMGILGTIAHIYRNERGLRGLYRGLLPEYYKVVPTVGLLFMANELLKTTFANISSRISTDV